MIKRIMSLVLCLSMLCTATVALAADEVKIPNDTIDFDEPGTVDITVISSNGEETNRPDVYSVEVVWGDMEFRYGYEYKTIETWLPDEHRYDTTTETDSQTPGWFMVNTTPLTSDGAKQVGLTTQDAVLVFNHSNKEVNAQISFADPDTPYDGTVALTPKFNLKSTSGNLTDNGNDLYTLTAGTEDDDGDKVEKWIDDGSSMMGTVSIEGTPDADDLATTPKAIAKLQVTISKVPTTTTTN